MYDANGLRLIYRPDGSVVIKINWILRIMCVVVISSVG